jgi:hypothetical protein
MLQHWGGVGVGRSMAIIFIPLVGTSLTSLTLDIEIKPKTLNFKQTYKEFYIKICNDVTAAADTH